MANMSSYDQVGKKEDISEVISNIAPTQVPFQSSIGSEKMHNTLHQWQEDTLDPPADKARVEGADAVAGTFVPTLMRTNISQIFSDTVQVTGTADAVTTYGRSKEMAYQLAKKSKTLKRDFEWTLVGSGQSRALGDSVSVARKMDAVQVMIDGTNKWHAKDSTNTLNGSDKAALNENVLLAAGQGLYNDGADASILMIKPSDANLVAAFASAQGRERDMGDSKKVVNVVDVYVCAFGSYKVVLNRFIKATDALLFDPSQWKKLTLRPWFRETLAKTGDSTKVQIVGEFSLKHRNFQASALISDLT